MNTGAGPLPSRWRGAGFVGVPLHPFLIAAVPVLFLLSHNISQVSLRDAVLPLVLVELLALALVAVLYAVCHNISRAAIGATCAVLLFLTYGHLAQFLREKLGLGSLLVGVLVLIVYLVLLALTFVPIARRTVPGKRTTLWLNLMGVVLVLTQVGQTAGRAIAVSGPVAPLYDISALQIHPDSRRGHLRTHKPDIYNLVFDRYAGQTALAEVYGFDNSGFLAELERRGFLVVDQARCNYARTDLSLASSLNLVYLNDRIKERGQPPLGRILDTWLEDYYLWRFLRTRGYGFVHFGTWWHGTAWNRHADLNINRLVLTEFGMLFYKTTIFYALGTLINMDSMRDQYLRERHKFEELMRVCRQPSPKFVFAHFLLPHEGFVFDREGRFQTRLAQSRRSVNANYVEQLEYTNRCILQSVDSILAHSTTPPIVVLQADEGPRPGVNFTGLDSLTSLRARYSILLAVLMPGSDSVFQSLQTSVNVFRSVLNGVFETHMEMLPESSYDYRAGRFVNVTPLLDARYPSSGHGPVSVE